MFRSIGKQVVIGVITGLLERLNSVKSTVIDCIDDLKTEFQSSDGELDVWDGIKEEEVLQTNLLSCIAIQTGNSVASHPDFIHSFSFKKYLNTALFGLFLFPANLRRNAGLSFNY